MATDRLCPDCRTPARRDEGWDLARVGRIDRSVQRRRCWPVRHTVRDHPWDPNRRRAEKKPSLEPSPAPREGTRCRSSQADKPAIRTTHGLQVAARRRSAMRTPVAHWPGDRACREAQGDRRAGCRSDSDPGTVASDRCILYRLAEDPSSHVSPDKRYQRTKGASLEMGRACCVGLAPGHDSVVHHPCRRGAHEVRPPTLA